MDRNIVRTYLDPALGIAKYSSQGLKYNCPHCDAGRKYNLEINLRKNTRRYLLFNCWSCHYKGHIKKIFKDYAIGDNWKGLPELIQTFVVDKKNVVTTTIELPITFPYYLSDEVSNYLSFDRNLHDLILTERKVLYCYSESEMLYNHIIFPYYEDGILIGYSSQDFKTKKYKNHRSLNFVAYKDSLNINYPIVITEGIYDCLSVPNSTPMLGTEPSEELLKFCKGKKVILALDNDVPLETKKGIGDKLYYYGASLVAIFGLKDYKDLNDWRVKDKEGLKTELKIIFDLLNGAV